MSTIQPVPKFFKGFLAKFRENSPPERKNKPLQSIFVIPAQREPRHGGPIFVSPLAFKHEMLGRNMLGRQVSGHPKFWPFLGDFCDFCQFWPFLGVSWVVVHFPDVWVPPAVELIRDFGPFFKSCNFAIFGIFGHFLQFLAIFWGRAFWGGISDFRQLCATGKDVTAPLAIPQI